MTCIFKHTKWSKYLAFDEIQIPLTEYTKTINSTASLVGALSKKKKNIYIYIYCWIALQNSAYNMCSYKVVES